MIGKNRIKVRVLFDLDDTLFVSEENKGKNH